MGLLDGISSSYNVLVKFGLDNAAFLKGLKQVEAATQRIGKNLTRNLTLPIIGLGVATVNASLKMNTAMSNIATLIPGATERVEELKKEIQDLAMVTGTATSEMTAGLYEVISAFGDTEDTMARVEANARLAIAGFSSVTEAINFTSAATKGYGDISAEAIQKASDLGLLTVRLGKTTFPALSGSIGRLTGNAKALGINLEELMAIYATLTGVTGDTTRVTTQADAAMRAFMKPIPGMAAAIKKLGYEGSEALVGDLGLVGALRAVLETTDGSVEAVGKLVESTEAFPLIFAVAGAQADVFDSKLVQMNDSLGTTDEAVKAATEGINAAGFKWDQFKVKLEVTAQRLGDKLVPAFTHLLNELLIPFLEKVAEWIQKFTELDPWTQKLILGIIALAAALGPLMLGFGGLITTVKVIIGLFSGPLGWIALLVAAGVAVFALGKRKKALREEAERLNKEIKLSEARLNNFKKEVDETTVLIDEQKDAAEEDADAFVELRDKVIELMDKYPEYRTELGYTIGDSGDLYDLNGNLIDSYDELQKALNNFSTKSMQNEYANLAMAEVEAFQVQAKAFRDFSILKALDSGATLDHIKEIEDRTAEFMRKTGLYIDQIGGSVDARREFWKEKDLDRLEEWALANLDVAEKVAGDFAGPFRRFKGGEGEVTGLSRAFLEHLEAELRLRGILNKVLEQEVDTKTDLTEEEEEEKKRRAGDGGAVGAKLTEEDQAILDRWLDRTNEIVEAWNTVADRAMELSWQIEFPAKAPRPSKDDPFTGRDKEIFVEAKNIVAELGYPWAAALYYASNGYTADDLKELGMVFPGDPGYEKAPEGAVTDPPGEKTANAFKDVIRSMGDVLLDSARMLGKSIVSGDIGQALNNVFNMLGASISEGISAMITTSIGGGGLFGSIVGAFGGGIVSGLFSLIGGLFGGGGKEPGADEYNPVYASITNWDQFFKFGFTLPASFLLSGRSRGFDVDPHGRSVDGLRDERRTDMHYNH